MDCIEPGQNDLSLKVHHNVPKTINHCAFIFERLDNDLDLWETFCQNMPVYLISCKMEEELNWFFALFGNQELDHANAVSWFGWHRDRVICEIEGRGFRVQENNSWLMIGDNFWFVVKDHLHAERLAGGSLWIGLEHCDKVVLFQVDSCEKGTPIFPDRLSIAWSFNALLEIRNCLAISPCIKADDFGYFFIFNDLEIQIFNAEISPWFLNCWGKNENFPIFDERFEVEHNLVFQILKNDLFLDLDVVNIDGCSNDALVTLDLRLCKILNDVSAACTEDGILVFACADENGFFVFDHFLD